MSNTYFVIFFIMIRLPPRTKRTYTLFPFTTLLRSRPRRAARTQKPLWRDQGADRDRGAAAGGEYRLYLAVCFLIVIARSEATRQSRVAYTAPGLLRFARNDEYWIPAIGSAEWREQGCQYG